MKSRVAVVNDLRVRVRVLSYAAALCYSRKHS